MFHLKLLVFNLGHLVPLTRGIIRIRVVKWSVVIVLASDRPDRYLLFTAKGQNKALRNTKTNSIVSTNKNKPMAN